MNSKLIKLIMVLALFASACGTSTTDAGTTTSGPDTTPATEEPEPAPTSSPDTDSGSDTDTDEPTTEAPQETPLADGTGTLAINLEPLSGVFIEGFEIGLRIESADGEVLYATLWTDFISQTGDTTLSRYYDSVLTQTLPAGPVVVLATVSVGAGPGPVTPDINGDLNCRLEVEVPDGSQVGVEIAFDARENCLSETTLT